MHQHHLVSDPLTCAGTGIPHLAIHTARPNAFMAAVLPPVLGPVQKGNIDMADEQTHVVVIVKQHELCPSSGD